ncbi:hypothetical protein BBP40_007439 [Aspergillus hancockii]|nr:hypothetical protein BBP40_007439 [Aspergillus hancockii]
MPTDALSILLASTAASLSLDLFIHPLDTIKTRIQSREYTQFLRANIGASVWRHPGIFRGLYQGIGSVIAASFPAAGAFFITYEYTQSRLQCIHQKLGTHDSNSAQVFSDMCAASVADLAACVVYAPADALKHNAQMIQSDHASGPASGKKLGGITLKATRLALKKFIHPRQLWSGYPALIDLAITEAGMVAATSAAVAGGIAGVLTAPMDLVRTRIMIDASDTNAPQENRIINAVREILRADGAKGLFRGCAISSFMLAVGSGLYFGFYEGTKCWLNSDSMDESSALG